MKLFRQVVAISIIFISTIFSDENYESKAKPKIEDLFKVSWSLLTYNKTVSVRNPAVVKGQGGGASERLSLSCQIEILDPNLVLGTCATPVIEQAKDGNDADIKIMYERRGSSSLNYEALRFNRRFLPFTQRPNWKTSVRSALGLSSARSRPQLVEEIQPMPMDIQLDVGLSKQPGSRISRVEGYFYALVVESFEYVEVPFKPSNDWVRLTADAEIRLKEAKCANSSFSFQIEEEVNKRAYEPISVQDFLPGRIVVGRQFINQDGKVTQHFSGIRRLPARVGGGGGGSGDDQIKSIRFVIGVNPKHCEIPFAFENIPIPRP